MNLEASPSLVELSDEIPALARALTAALQV